MGTILPHFMDRFLPSHIFTALMPAIHTTEKAEQFSYVESCSALWMEPYLTLFIDPL